jgi:uncharacterized protein with HEPN domain
MSPKADRHAERVRARFFGVSLKVVWNTAMTQIDKLEKAVRALLE